MMVNLSKLSRAELRLALDILNAKVLKRDGKITGPSTLDLDRRGAGYANAEARQAKISPPWKRGRKHIRGLRGEWERARRKFETDLAFARWRSPERVIVQLPPIALPSKNPPARISWAGDLVAWLFARALANRQALRFVKCARPECRKWALRKRARRDARFCSADCQAKANAEHIKQRWTTRFEQPRTRRRHGDPLARMPAVSS